jgi:hypothetical protein
MTKGRKVLALAGMAAMVGLGGCAQLMPRLGLMAGPGECGTAGLAFSQAAPWRAPRPNILAVRQQVAVTGARFTLGYNDAVFHQALASRQGAGECAVFQ